MIRDPRIAVAMAAVSVAYSARAGGLSPDDVDMLVARAQQELAPDDPLARAVTAFATEYQAVWANSAALEQAGAELLSATELALRPDPVDAGRVDIHG